LVSFGGRSIVKQAALARWMPGRADSLTPFADQIATCSPGAKRCKSEGVKHIRHPLLGPLAFEYSAFAVDGRPDLSMVVYNPASTADADKISSLIGSVSALERKRATAGAPNAAGKTASARRLAHRGRR